MSNFKTGWNARRQPPFLPLGRVAYPAATRIMSLTLASLNSSSQGAFAPPKLPKGVKLLNGCRIV